MLDVAPDAVGELALRPLTALERQLEEARAGRPTKLEGQYPSEIPPLVDQLNALIDYSAEVIARGRAEAGNLAHGLRSVQHD